MLIKRSLILTLIFCCLGIAHSQDAAVDEVSSEQTQPAVENDDAKKQSEQQKKQEQQKKKTEGAKSKPPKDVFKPSEEISEDLPVPFPVDI